MRKYKVIALSVSGKGSKIHHSGETVFENNFNDGHANLLVESGFLQYDGESVDAPVDATPSEPVQVEFSESVVEEAPVVEEINISFEDESEEEEAPKVQEVKQKGNKKGK